MMSKELYKILELDNEITELFIQDRKLNDSKIQDIVLNIKRKIIKLNNQEILYLLKNGNGIHEFMDVLDYLKKYKINKKELKENNSYKEELKKLNKFIEIISDSAINDEEYMYICNKCDVDNIANYLLSNMTNSDIMELSNNSDDWNYKLFLFGNLKS